MSKIRKLQLKKLHNKAKRINTKELEKRFIKRVFSKMKLSKMELNISIFEIKSIINCLKEGTTILRQSKSFPLLHNCFVEGVLLNWRIPDGEKKTHAN